MKIQTKWVFGNFHVGAETEVETAEPIGATAQMLMEAGFLQILQRGPASAAEKKLAGYEKRPKGFQRGSIPWSEANALTLVEGFGSETNVGTKDEPQSFRFRITDVTENVGGEQVSSRKMATEMAGTVKDDPAMRAVLKLAPDATFETIVETCHAFLAKFRKGKGKGVEKSEEKDEDNGDESEG